MKHVVSCFLLVIILTHVLHLTNEVQPSPMSKHLFYWELALPFPLTVGGLEHKLTQSDMLRLHNHIDIDHGIKGESKRHTSSHDPTKVAEWAASNGMHPQAAFNAAVIHNVVDMADPGPAGVNGHNATKTSQKEAQSILDRLEDGKSPMTGIFKKSWPKWAVTPGPRAKQVYRFAQKFVKENELIVKIVKSGDKLVKIVVKGATIFTLVYEGGRLVYTELFTENGLKPEDVVKAVTEGASISAGVWAGAKVGAKVCAPLNVIEPGGPVYYLLCTAAFTVAGAVTGEKIGRAVMEIALYQKRDAVKYVKSDNDIKAFLESEGYFLEGGPSAYWLVWIALILSILLVVMCYSYKKRKRILVSS